MVDDKPGGATTATRSLVKGFTRDSAPKADTQRVMTPLRQAGLSPTDLGSGRGFSYEWEQYMSAVMDRVSALETTAAAGNAWSALTVIALTNPVDVSTAPGVFGGYMLYNPNPTPAFVQVFDALAADVTLGTTPPAYVLSMPASSAANIELTNGIDHTTAISVAASTVPNGGATPGTALVATFFFR